MKYSCPVCLTPNEVLLVEKVKQGQIIKCGICEVQFVVPLPSNVPVFVDFSLAGKEILANLNRKNNINKFVTPTEKAILKIINNKLKKGAVVLELCFETGRFLKSLLLNGFMPLGLDPIQNHVDLMNQALIKTKLGLLEEIDKSWPEPNAVVLIESLVRFPEPLILLKRIRELFPNSLLLVTVPSSRRSLKAPGYDRMLNYPPDHLTRWNQKSLSIALKNSGYSSTIKKIYIDVNSLEVPWVIKKIIKMLYILFGEGDYSFLAIGKPNKSFIA